MYAQNTSKTGIILLDVYDTRPSTNEEKRIFEESKKLRMQDLLTTKIF